MACAIALALFSLLVVLLPRVIDQKPVIAKIEAEVSRRFEGEVGLQGIELSLWPRPHIIFDKAVIDVAGKVAGEFDALWVYPDLFSLLKGELRLSRVVLEGAKLAFQVPEEGFRAEGIGTLSGEEIAARLSSWLTALRMAAPDLDVSVKDGTLALTTSEKVVFWFRRINGHASTKSGLFSLGCESNLFESLSLKLALDTANLRSEGEIALRAFQPQSLISYGMPDAALWVEEPQADLNLRFKTRGLLAAEGTLTASWPALTVKRRDRKAVFTDGRIHGDFSIEGGRMRVTLAELKLGSPRLAATGELLVSGASGGGQPSLALKLWGNDIQVEPVRAAALALAGDTAAVRNLFAVVKGGTVPEIAFAASGTVPRDLGMLENITLTGEIADGKVAVPKPAMDLTGVTGKVAIRKGILEGTASHARYGGTRGYDGSITLGLIEGDRVFKLDIALATDDLKPLPSLLRQVVTSEALLDKIGRIEELQGKALGRLVLEGTLEAIRTRVEAADFRLHLRWLDLASPLRLEGKRFLFDGAAVEVEELDAALGDSRVSGLSGRIGVGKTRSIRIDSASADLSMEEIDPLLARSETLRVAMNGVRAVKGTVSVSALNLSGPWDLPEKWRYRAAGSVKNLAIEATMLPGTLFIKTGRFDATPEGFGITHAEISLLDAAVNLSGLLKPLPESDAVRLELRGSLGPESVRWLEGLSGLPRELSPRTPLSIGNALFRWDKFARKANLHGEAARRASDWGAGISLSGEISPEKGPKVELDLFAGPGELAVNKLSIEDADSYATVRFGLKEGKADLIFAGNLTKASLDRLLRQNDVLGGWIKGAFRASLSVRRPLDSTADGSLEGQDIFIPWGLQSSLAVESAALIASGKEVKIVSADLAWRDDRMTLEGTVSLSPQALRFDLAAAAERLDGNKLAEAIEKERRAREGRESDLLASLPLEGSVRLDSSRFDFNAYTLSPLSAKLTVKEDETEIRLLDAGLCGLSTPGVWKWSSNGRIEFRVAPAAKNQELGPTMSCLLGKKEPVSGTFDLQSELAAGGAREELPRNARGKFRFKARNGKIFELSISGRILNRIFTVLNLPRLFAGKLPDLAGEGFVYSDFVAEGEVDKGKLLFSEIVLDGESMKLLGEGELDLEKRQIDLAVMVAPLKTLDWMIGKIPGIRNLLGGGLAIIPVRVSGSLDQPTVIPLDPGVVGSKLLGIAKRTFAFPFKLINPLFSGRQIEKE